MIDFIRKEGFSTLVLASQKVIMLDMDFKSILTDLYFDDALDTTVEDDFSFARKTIEQLEMNSHGSILSIFII